MIPLLASNTLFAQSWNLVKDKDGIKVYTRAEPNSTLKSFRGEAMLDAPVDKISRWIMDPGKREWWADTFTELTLLDYKEGKYIRYYAVYGLPWPLTDRDIATETRLSEDSITGVTTMVSRPIPDAVPDKA